MSYLLTGGALEIKKPLTSKCLGLAEFGWGSVWLLTCEAWSWLPGCLELASWLADWAGVGSAAWLPVWQAAWPTGWLVGWLVGWLAGWQGSRLCGWTAPRDLGLLDPQVCIAAEKQTGGAFDSKSTLSWNF